MALGIGDSLFLTGAMAWGVQLGGPQNAGKGLMSVGIALYAAMAIGAPLGIAMFNSGGFGPLALIIAATPLLACLIAYRLPAQPVVSGARIPLREGLRPDLASRRRRRAVRVGFAVIAAFITLYYQSRGWNGAAYGLTAFGVAFIVARFFFGGYRIGLAAPGSRLSAWLSNRRPIAALARAFPVIALLARR